MGPSRSVHLYDCDDSWVHDVTILADPLYYNTDGIGATVPIPLVPSGGCPTR